MSNLCQAVGLVRYIFSETTAGRPIRNIADTEEFEDKGCMSEKLHTHTEYASVFDSVVSSSDVLILGCSPRM